MSAPTAATRDLPAAPRWRLWVDGCGGFLMLGGSRWTVGGLGERATADVCVRADWPRKAGTIEAVGGDYFWQPARPEERRVLILPGKSLPVTGTAAVTLAKPSPLSESAVLQVRPPHRFDQHVDAVILGGTSVLIGPGANCHIRCRDSSQRALLMLRGETWMVKTDGMTRFEVLEVGKRSMLEQVAITLENA